MPSKPERELLTMHATLAASPTPQQISRQAPVAEAGTGERTYPRVAGEHHRDEGHGRRLLSAFEALETFPALAESRDRLRSLISKPDFATAEVVCAVESDVALIITVLRLANRNENGDGRMDTALSAVKALSIEAVRAVADCVGTFDFFERVGGWDAAPERFRQHALATQRIADRLAATVDYESRDRLSITSLLHDVGKLVLLHAYPGYPAKIHQQARTPEERIHQERRELGVDHALVGGVLVRRWGLPKSLATPIEHHHDRNFGGDAAFIRLADMLAHHEQGESISPSELLASARAIGLEPKELRRLMYELPSAASQRRRHIDPCPMSRREHGVLRLLAEGNVYKQIGQELGLSTSTVRTHLHNIYRKLGAADRAQAVLIATERGWL
jgi:HD-like signal output (HDOD) protein/DNA-binding CsgD family transcriptional regulator